MSEIKDNKDIEEVKESEARYNKPCKPDKANVKNNVANQKLLDIQI